MIRLDLINGWSEAEARKGFEACCGSRRWVDAMVRRRPFASEATLLAAADLEWFRLGRDDWLEAFSHHPRIGDVAKLREKFAATAAWAQGEQAGVRGADEAVIQGLAQGNRDYEARFGHIFLVCATGKTASEMLGLLQARMAHPPAEELEVAAGEQAKITRIRLAKIGS